MLFGKHINKYYLIFSGALLLGIVALFAVDIYQLKIPEIYGSIIDGLDGSHEMLTKEKLLSLVKEMFLIVAVMVVGRILWRICFFGSAIKVETMLREKMFDHCKDLPQEYYSTNKVGSLMALFTNDLSTIQECFGDGVIMFFDALMLGSLAIYKMFQLNVVLALLSLFPLVLILLIGIVVGKYMMKKWEIRQEAYSNLSDFSQESFSGIAVIKAFVKEAKELSAFRRLNKENENANVAYVKASTLLNILITLLVQSVMCLILGYGGYLVYHDSSLFSIGDLIKFASYFNSTIWPMMAVSNLIDLTSRGKASLKRVSELLDYKNNVCDKENVIQLDEIKGDIEFKNLTFTYPGSDYAALENISFHIHAGENIGIVGKTGCGKTTLVDLILRTYNVPEQTLFIDGYDVNDLPIKLVRQFCAYVPQDNFLFSDKIKNNIAFAFDSIEDEKVIKAAKEADIHENIMEFDQKYDTVLGERGVTISGGQKQRTSIARALMKKASILILDDSVSAVDTKTEETILKNLKETRKGKTTILIAHRISTIENMDKILFLEDGKIVDFGSHEELLNRCLAYQKMVMLQKLEDEEGEAS